MTAQGTCALVLRIVDHGEADKLVTLFSIDLGRITGIAKGARKSTRRFVNKLEPFTLLQVFCRPPRNPAGLYLISDAELLNAHISLRRNYFRYAAASYLSELVLRFTHEHDPDPRLFTVLRWALLAIDEGRSPLKIATFAHLLFLTGAGYRPELEECGRCRQPVHPPCTYLLLAAGGALLCSKCHPGAGGTSRLSVQTLRVLAAAQSTTLNRLDRLQPPPRVLSEALQALHQFSLQILQQDLKAWQALQSLSDRAGES